MPETAPLPAAGPLEPDAVRAEVGRAMTDTTHPMHPAYEQATKWGNRAEYDTWADGLYRRLPGAVSPVLPGVRVGAVEVGGGIAVEAARPPSVTPKPDGPRPATEPPAADPAAAESSPPDLAALAERYPDLHREWGGDFQARMDTAAEAVGRLQEEIASATGKDGAEGGEMLLDLAREAGFSDAQILRFLSGR